MSDIWVIMIAVGILTYLTRLSFILLLDKWQPPEIVTRALRYVPVAVLTAIIVPELVVVDNALDFSLGNARMLAGILAILVAWRTKSALWTIAIGFAAFLLLNASSRAAVDELIPRLQDYAFRAHPDLELQAADDRPSRGRR